MLKLQHQIVFPIEVFWERAWRPKLDHPLQGDSSYFVVPNTVFNEFPILNSLLYQKSTDVVNATSGFQAGICSLISWQEILITGGYSHYQTDFPRDCTEVQANSLDSCIFQTRKNFKNGVKD